MATMERNGGQRKYEVRSGRLENAGDSPFRTHTHKRAHCAILCSRQERTAQHKSTRIVLVCARSLCVLMLMLHSRFAMSKGWFERDRGRR
jgi:hypothetical protein